MEFVPLIAIWAICQVYRAEALFCQIAQTELCNYVLVNDDWVPAPTPPPPPKPPPPTAFIVSLECRDRLAISGYYSACKEVNIGNQLPFCEIRDADDTRALSANVRISGASQVHVCAELIRCGRVDPMIWAVSYSFSF